MFNKNVPKNQKENQNRKFHMKAILNEVKNKWFIDEIENERKFIGSNIIKNKIRKRIKIQKVQEDQLKVSIMKVSQVNKPPTEESTKKSQKELDDKELNAVLSHLNPIQLRKHREEPRRSSRMEMQLQEIIRYSKLYPSRNNSQRSLEGSIKKLLDTKLQISPPRHGKSKFAVITSQSSDQNIQTETQMSKRSRTARNTQSKQNILLNLVDFNVLNIHDERRQKKVNFLLKKSKQACNKNTQLFDYSLESFIQNHLNTVRMKQGRKTVGYFNRRRDRNQRLDIRQQKIPDLHRFLRGEAKQDAQLSNYVNSKQIEKFRTKYDIYDTMYKKTKDGINNQRFNIHDMKELTLKNAVYLNQIKQQPQGRQKRVEIEKQMRRIHFVY